ncbi:hypothetical protein QWY77_14040 [Thalassotalea ponticola]|uniref:hypothetical protein n=1 Tax=Thalassotalea ponticola TaxID=1523392 RepID=UPI0025B2F04B|nr:hypothetical protein [Thalassotalea ponticola]MDN3653860.1 hypothetical protein [Thalassotalea ponticola]
MNIIHRVKSWFSVNQYRCKTDKVDVDLNVSYSQTKAGDIFHTTDDRHGATEQSTPRKVR